MLNADDATVVLIDYQAGLILYQRGIAPPQLKNNPGALAKVAEAHKLSHVRNKFLPRFSAPANRSN